MSFFAVTSEVISEIRNVENADRLEIAKLKNVDFQFVVGKGQFQINEQVIYFPVDSILPDWLIEKLGLTGKLSGKDKNRIKTIKLRGEISQGIVAKYELAKEYFESALPLQQISLTDFFQVIKYEPPEIYSNDCTLGRLPIGLSMYDIEGAERNQEVIKYLVDNKIPVCITEKLEGTNFSITFEKETGKIYINQRNHTIYEKLDANTLFWATARNMDLIKKIKALAELIEFKQHLTLYGELIGPKIQGNYYQLSNNTVYFYDIKCDNTWWDVDAFGFWTNDFKLPIVPIIIYNDCIPCTHETIKQYSNGKSLLKTDKLREGIVIRPMYEENYPSFGRLIIKQRSPEYLSKSEN